MTLCGDPFYYIRTVTSSKNFYIDKFYTKIFISRGVHLPDPWFDRLQKIQMVPSVNETTGY